LTEAANGGQVLVDTDVGIDDSLAILVALAAPEVKVVGIGSTYGNCRSAQAANNALCVLEAAGRPDVPVCVGVAEPPSAGPLIDLAAPVHGGDGLGNTGLKPSYLVPSEESAVEQILRVSEQSGGRTGLLALGPLTNLAAAVHEDPLVLGRFRSVVIMGGMGPEDQAASVIEKYPRYHQVGDPNTRHNPAATAVVAGVEAPITWVGMNVTGPLLLPATLLDEVAASGKGTAVFSRDVHQCYVEFLTQAWRRAERVFNVHDTVAASLMIDPAVATRVVRAAPVLLYDEQGRGQLWGARPGPRSVVHRFVTAVDARSIERFIRLALQAGPDEDGGRQQRGPAGPWTSR